MLWQTAKKNKGLPWLSQHMQLFPLTTTARLTLNLKWYLVMKPEIETHIFINMVCGIAQKTCQTIYSLQVCLFLPQTVLFLSLNYFTETHWRLKSYQSSSLWWWSNSLRQNWIVNKLISKTRLACSVSNPIHGVLCHTFFNNLAFLYHSRCRVTQ